MLLPASFYAAPPSPWVWPGRGPAITTPAVRAFQPAPPSAALAGLPGPTGRFPGPFSGGPVPVPPTVPALPDSEMHSPTPRAFAEFFRVPHPLLSSRPGTLYHRPPQISPLWLPRWHNQMLWSLHRALPRTWSRAGRRTSCARSNLAGHSSLVTLHLSRPWVPLFLLRTWAPARCGSWVPQTTERRYGLSVRPDQNEQTVASVKAVVLVSDLLLTDIGTGSGTAESLLTPPPRPDACLLPPNAHG